MNVRLRQPPLIFIIVALALFSALCFVQAAYGQVPGPGDPASQPEGPVQVGVNIWLVLLGSVTPAVSYLLNHYAPWANEQIKALVLVGLAAGVAVLYQGVLSADSTLGFNVQTLVAVITAVGTAVLAHSQFYARSGLAQFFGAGSNANGEPNSLAAGLSAQRR